MSRRPLAAILAVAIAVVLAGCGDDEAPEDAAPARQEPVPAAAVLEAVRDPGPGPRRIDTTLEAELEGEARGAVGAFVDTPLELRVSGEVDTATRAADLDVTLDAGLLKVDGRYLGDGARNYLELLEQWYTLPASSEAAAPLDTVGILGRPGDLLEPGAVVVGTETVEGVECDVVEGRARPERVAEGLGSVLAGVPVLGLGGLDAAAVREGVGPTEARLWIGREDHEVHRVRLESTLEPGGTELGAQGVTGGDLVLDAATVRTDGTIEVQAPAGAKPIEELRDALGGLSLPGLSGGGAP